MKMSLFSYQTFFQLRHQLFHSANMEYETSRLNLVLFVIPTEEVRSSSLRTFKLFATART